MINSNVVESLIIARNKALCEAVEAKHKEVLDEIEQEIKKAIQDFKTEVTIDLNKLTDDERIQLVRYYDLKGFKAYKYLTGKIDINWSHVTTEPPEIAEAIGRIVEDYI